MKVYKTCYSRPILVLDMDPLEGLLFLICSFTHCAFVHIVQCALMRLMQKVIMGERIFMVHLEHGHLFLIVCRKNQWLLAAAAWWIIKTKQCSSKPVAKCHWKVGSAAITRCP